MINYAVASAPVGAVRKADSIFSELDKRGNNAGLFNHLDTLIRELLYNNTSEALSLSQKQYRYAVKLRNQKAEARALLSIGIAFDMKGKYNDALTKYAEALSLARRQGMPILAGDIYNNFSITHAVLGNMEESVTNALKALSIFETAKDSNRLARIYNNLGSRYSEMGYYDQALEYYQKAARLNEYRQDFKKLAFNFGNIGLLYYEKDENQKALEYFKRSIALQDTLNDKYNYSIGLHNLALAYQRLGEFDKALDYEMCSLAIASENNDGLGKITSMNGIASIYRSMKNDKLALTYFKKSEALAGSSGARYYLINIYQNMAEIYAGMKDYRNAFLYNTRFASLKDSIMSSEKDKAARKIKEFENTRTRQEIKLLTKEGEIQRLKIKRQKIIRNSVSVVGILLLLLAAGLFHRYRYVRRTRNELSEKNKMISHEKDRSDALLLNILPAETAEELKSHGKSEARHFEMVTVMFADFKGFTYMAEKLSPQELVNEIDLRFRKFDEIITNHGIEKIKTIGDAYMCAGGIPVPNNSNALDVVAAALEMQQFTEELKISSLEHNRPYFEIRIGIHTGPVVAGIVGTKKFQYDIWGDTVNIASRMESSGEVGRVNISQSTYEFVSRHFECSYRGKVDAKNKGAIDMYFVNGRIT